MIFYTGVDELLLTWPEGYREVEMSMAGGRKLIVWPQDFGRGRIVRLISTDPMDFLRSELKPGEEIILTQGDGFPGSSRESN